jgi:tripartite-type tricarboxylate transporter receptor subunit TctC
MKGVDRREQEGRMRFRTILAITAALAAPTAATAQNGYPVDAITIIVGFNPGGGTDTMARSVAPLLADHLGGDVEISVVNRPGAGGQIGWTELAAAEPDGATLGTMNLPSMVAKLYDRNPEFDIDSFTFIGSVMRDPSVMIVRADSPYESLDDVLNAAAEQPGALTYAIGGLGGEDHFAAVQIEAAAEVDFTIVPFGGAAPARSALLGGHVALGGVNLSEVAEFGEQVRIIAIYGAERSPLAPDAPTAAEQGYDVEIASIRGIAAPAGLPEDVETRLIEAFEAMAEDPDFLDLREERGFPLEVVTGQAYRDLAEQQSEVAERVWNETPWQ